MEDIRIGADDYLVRNKFLRNLMTIYIRFKILFDVIRSYCGVLSRFFEANKRNHVNIRSQTIESLIQLGEFLRDSEFFPRDVQSSPSPSHGNLELPISIESNESDIDFSDSSVRFLGTEFTQSIGHIISGLQYRVMAKELGFDSTDYIVVGKRHANHHLFHNYLKSKIPLLDFSKLSTEVFEFTNKDKLETIGKVQMHGQMLPLLQASALLNRDWSLSRTGDSFLELSDSDEEIGQHYLRSKGLRDSDWFVTLHPRWTGQGLSDPRNVEINSYRDATNWIIDQGGFVFRIGLNDGKIMDFEHKQYIDYSSSNERSEQLDIFLAAKAKMFIATSSGLSHLAMSFGTPVLHSNITNMGVYPFYPKSMYVPKLKMIHGINEKSFISDINKGVYDVDHFTSGQYPYSLRDNTSEEILEACKEFLLSINSSLKYEERLSNPITSLISLRNNYPTTPISASFYDAHATYFNR